MVTITLPPELEKVVAEQAEQTGTTAELLALGALHDRFLARAPRQPPRTNMTRRSVVDVLAEAPGHLVFQNADEVDVYISSERDAWVR